MLVVGATHEWFCLDEGAEKVTIYLWYSIYRSVKESINTHKLPYIFQISFCLHCSFETLFVETCG